MSGREYSEADDAQLRALLAEKLSYAEIARRMQRAESGIHGRLRRLGIEKPAIRRTVVERTVSAPGADERILRDSLAHANARHVAALNRYYERRAANAR